MSYKEVDYSPSDAYCGVFKVNEQKIKGNEKYERIALPQKGDKLSVIIMGRKRARRVIVTVTGVYKEHITVRREGASYDESYNKKDFHTGIIKIEKRFRKEIA